VPTKLKECYRQKEGHFTRKRKLPFSWVITFVLSITTSGKSKGIDSKSSDFFKNAQRSGLWPKAKAVDRSAVTKARKKVNWRIFEEIFYEAVRLAYKLWPEHSGYKWKGMSVYGVDGSKYSLPATPQLRREFDPGSGLENAGKGHYPQCLVTTIYDVFRRLPIARSVVGYANCERTQAQKLIPKVPAGNVMIFDRGYPGFNVFKFLNKNYDGYYLFRSTARSTFPAVEEFIKSRKAEDMIYLEPTKSRRPRRPKKLNQSLGQTRIPLRVIRLESPDGNLSVLLTNLMDKKTFSMEEITQLYFRRWEIESMYRDEKIFLEVDTFHSRNSNGIRQELFAALIMNVIAKILMNISCPSKEIDISNQPEDASNKTNPLETLEERTKEEAVSIPGQSKSIETPLPLRTLPEPQFKHAVMRLAVEAAILTPANPRVAVKIFRELLEEIRRVKYYRPKKPRKSTIRITRRAINKWADKQARKRKVTHVP